MGHQRRRQVVHTRWAKWAKSAKWAKWAKSYHFATIVAKTRTGTGSATTDTSGHGLTPQTWNRPWELSLEAVTVELSRLESRPGQIAQSVWVGDRQVARPAQSVFDALRPSERRVIEAFALGGRNTWRTVALRLGLSAGTVRWTMMQIRAKAPEAYAFWQALRAATLAQRHEVALKRRTAHTKKWLWAKRIFGARQAERWQQ